MPDTVKINVSREVFDARLKVAALIAELNQITHLVDDPEFLTWKKNREFELIGVTQKKERTFAGEKPRNNLQKREQVK